MRKVTVKQYADEIKASVTTARKRLEKLREDGQAFLEYRWEEFKMPRACRGIRKPPAHRVAVYTLMDK